MRHTEDPENLIMPTLATVQHIAGREGLGELTEDELDFVWDLMAKAGGAQVKPFDEFEAQAEAAVHAFGEADAFTTRTGVTTPYLVEKFESDYYEYLRQQHLVVEDLDLNEMPGYNTPTKAVRVLRLFREVQLLWILLWVDVALMNLMDLLNAAFARMESLDPEFTAILKTFAGGDNPEEEALMLGLELQLCNIQLEEMLRIARHLDKLSEFTNAQADPTPDPNGEEVVLRDIQDLGELGRASQSAYTLPPRLRLKQAAMGETQIREPQTRHDKKQLLYMVVDGSGSMLEYNCLAASRAAGVVMNRLQAVIDGDAELYLRFFDETLREQEYHANSPESAQELMRIVSSPLSYMGDDTRFRQPLEVASQHVQKLMESQGLRDPELIFITDGEATVPPIETLHGIKMHTVQVGESENVRLSALARKSGGLGLYAGVTMGMDAA